MMPTSGTLASSSASEAKVDDGDVVVRLRGKQPAENRVRKAVEQSVDKDMMEEDVRNMDDKQKIGECSSSGKLQK